MAVETARIQQEYARRERELPPDRYSVSEPGARFLRDSRLAEMDLLLTQGGLLPLGDRHILDVGCGRGDWLLELESRGARRDRLAGIDLIPSRVGEARARLEGADIRTGNATELPWGAGTFEVVVLSTVLSSILDGDMRRAVASEAARVLLPSGAILWYDFFLDNPWNRGVRGVRRREIETLFPGFGVALKTTTLAPPLARWLAPRFPTVAERLAGLRVFSTHLLGLLAKPG
jgi:SAM-dependent methyltransferase